MHQATKTIRLLFNPDEPWASTLHCASTPGWGRDAQLLGELDENLPAWIEAGGGFVQIARSFAVAGLKTVAVDLGPHSSEVAHELNRRDAVYHPLEIMSTGRQIRLLHPHHPLIQALVTQREGETPGLETIRRVVYPLVNHGGLPGGRPKAMVLLGGGGWVAQRVFANASLIADEAPFQFTVLDDTVTDDYINECLVDDSMTFCTTETLGKLLSERFDMSPPTQSLATNPTAWAAMLQALLARPPLNFHQGAFCLMEPRTGSALVRDGRPGRTGLLKIKAAIERDFRRRTWYLTEAIASDRLNATIVADTIRGVLSGSPPLTAVRCALEQAFRRGLGIEFPGGYPLFQIRHLHVEASEPPQGGRCALADAARTNTHEGRF